MFKLVHLCSTYALSFHVQVRLLRPAKDAEPCLQSRPWAESIYEGQAGQGQRIHRFLSAFVSLLLSHHFFSCPSLWDNQWPEASHYSKRCFFGHLGYLTPLYNVG